MKYPVLVHAAAFALVLGAGGVLAQTAPAAPDTAAGSPVVSDVGPPPAHERNSLGAIVLEDSPVRAQRDRDFESAPRKAGAKAVGRNAKRSTMKAQTRSELNQAREDEALEFYRRGAGGVTPK